MTIDFTGCLVITKNGRAMASLSQNKWEIGGIVIRSENLSGIYVKGFHAANVGPNMSLKHKIKTLWRIFKFIFFNKNL